MSVLADFDRFGPTIAYFYKKCDLSGSLGNLFHLQGMSYNNENCQVDAGRCFGKLISGGISIFWILLFSKKNLDKKNQFSP